MIRRLDYAPNNEHQEETIGNFLRNKGFSSHLLRVLKKQPGAVLLDGKPVFNNLPIGEGRKITVFLSDEKPSENIRPVEIPVDIIYEDEDLLVINKAAGLNVHPSSDGYEESLANALAYYFQKKNQIFVFRAANRLDRFTSGLILIAKNLLSAGVFYDFLQKKLITREYLAIVKGKIDVAGSIQGPIARIEENSLQRCVDWQKGRKALTYYQGLLYREKDDLSLVKLNLATGRTHQIRVHMQYLGYPLLGDFLYGIEDERIQRQALHAFHLSFPHPITGQILNFQAPLPADMADLLK